MALRPPPALQRTLSSTTPQSRGAATKKSNTASARSTGPRTSVAVGTARPASAGVRTTTGAGAKRVIPKRTSSGISLRRDTVAGYVDDEDDGRSIATTSTSFSRTADEKKLAGSTRSAKIPSVQSVSQPTIGGTPPAARAYHTASLVGAEIWVVGGTKYGSSGTPFADVHVLDTQTLQWRRPDLRGVIPSISHHTAVVAEGVIYLFGGWDGSRRSSTLWALDTGAGTIQEMDTGGDRIPGHSSHAAVLLAGATMMVIGRRFGQRRWSDTHIIGLSSLRWQLCSESAASRSGHTATTVGGKVFVYGGRRDPSMDVIDARSYTGGKVGFKKDVTPVGRSYHSATAIGRSILYYGGLVEGLREVASVMFFDTEAYRFHLDDVRLPARYAHSATLIGEQLFIVGGVSEGALTNDVMILQVS